MSFKRFTTMALGLTAAMSVTACDMSLIEELPGSQSVSIQAPGGAAVQAPKVSAPRVVTKRPSAPRVQTASVQRKTTTANSAPAPTHVAASSKPSKITAESCAIQQVAGCAFLAFAGGHGDGRQPDRANEDNGSDGSQDNSDPGGGGGQSDPVQDNDSPGGGGGPGAPTQVGG